MRKAGTWSSTTIRQMVAYCRKFPEALVRQGILYITRANGTIVEAQIYRGMNWFFDKHRCSRNKSPWVDVYIYIYLLFINGFKH